MADSADCLDPDVAAGYAEHRLADDEIARVETHIDTCAACRELVSMLARLHYAQPASPTSDADARVIGGVLPRGARIGPFEIEEALDAGGMGLVYAAHDTRLARRVAVKCVRDLRGDSSQLMQEARMMAQLAHPNVVPVHDVIEVGDQIYLAMELVVGRNVRQWLDDAPRRWPAIVDVFIAAGAGLAAAHAAGIVHGDVKPANILVGDDGRVRITDFGLASYGLDPADGELAVGSGSGVRGTPAYMSPEQRAGVPCDAAGDQYALCASIHEALFGAPPARPPTKAPRLSRALRRALARGLADAPRDRHASVDALLRELRATRSARRRWIAAGSAAALAIGVVAFGVGEHRAQHALCAEAAPRIASPWTGEARGMIERQFGLTREPYVPATLERVETSLDRWSDDLDHARAGVCEASWFERGVPREQVTATLDCLESRVVEGSALISQLREADAPAILAAVGASAGLTPVARCAEAPPRRVLAPDSPTLQHVRELWARAHALGELGNSRAQLPAAQEALAAALELGDPGTEGAARVAVASAQSGVSDLDGAETNLLKALRLTERAQDDRTRAQAWFNLVQVEAWRGRWAQAELLGQAALGAAERVNDVYMQSEMLMTIGGAISQLGRAKEAQPMFAQAVAMRRTLYGEHDARLSAALSALGNGYAMAGDLEAGIAAHREAMVIGEAALGSAHPTVGTLHSNLADDYLWALREPEAIGELAASRDVFVASEGETSRKLAMTLTDLATAYLLSGDMANAATTADRAEAIWQRVAAEHPDRADALLARYVAHHALGEPADLADLETADKLAAQLPPFMHAREQMALGQAVPPGPRARELVSKAAAGFATSSLPLAQRELAACRAWLAERAP